MVTGNADFIRIIFQLSLLIIALILAVGVVDVFAGNSKRSAHESVSSLSSLPEEVAAVQEAEAVKVIEVAAPVKETLTPRMRAVLDHVTQRYRVSPEALGPIFEAAQLIGRERSLDPLIIVAIIGIESGFNPFAQSSKGAQGLMQVIPRFHQDKVPDGAGKLPLFDPVTNVQIGAHVLQEAIRLRGGLMAGLQQFGGAVDDEEQAYAAKVLAEKQRLEQAAHRTGAAKA
jgi:soluble lytic murein transglycosylase-like protein